MTKLLRLTKTVIIKPAYLQSVSVVQEDTQEWVLLFCLPDDNRIKIPARDEKMAQTMFETLCDVLFGERSLSHEEINFGLFCGIFEEEIRDAREKRVVEDYFRAKAELGELDVPKEMEDEMIGILLGHIMETTLKTQSTDLRNE